MKGIKGIKSGRPAAWSGHYNLHPDWKTIYHFHHTIEATLSPQYIDQTRLTKRSNFLMPVLPSRLGSSFDTDLRDRHLIYEYAARDTHGNPETWRYEMWFYNEDRIIYAIHSGPMAGRKNFQTATYQCIRPGEIWQCNWLEETGTIISMVIDIAGGKVTTLAAFSKGHWENRLDALGDKRKKEDFARWRKLAEIGSQIDRKVLSEQATIVESFRGGGDLEGIRMDWPTM